MIWLVTFPLSLITMKMWMQHLSVAMEVEVSRWCHANDFLCQSFSWEMHIFLVLTEGESVWNCLRSSRECYCLLLPSHIVYQSGIPHGPNFIFRLTMWCLYITHTQTPDIPVVLTTTVTQPTNLKWFSVQNDLFQMSEDPLEVFPSHFQPRPGSKASVLIME